MSGDKKGIFCLKFKQVLLKKRDEHWILNILQITL